MESNDSDNQILAYRITRRLEDKLLDDEVIEHNMYESDNIHNTQYIMSIGTSWLRAHPGSTLYDLELKLEELGIKTIIFASPKLENSKYDYDLCVPANPEVKPVYIAQFVPDMRKNREVYLRNIRETTVEENLERLKLAGITCAKGQVDEVTRAKMPSIDSLKQNVSIHTQLQWALASIEIERFNPEQTLKDEIDKCMARYTTGPFAHRVEPFRYQVTIEDIPIDFLIMPEEGRINIVSEFGTMYREGKPHAIHIKTFVKNMYREKHQISDPDEKTNQAITRAASKFNVNKIINATEEEKNQIVSYLEHHLRTEGDFPVPPGYVSPTEDD